MRFNILLSIIPLVSTSKLNIFEPTIGKWKLLYSTNEQLINNNFDLQILPSKNKINELFIQIKKYESYGFVTFTKIINCGVVDKLSDTIGEHNKYPLTKNFDLCSLFVLKSEKYIKSIGIFEFPYFAVNYVSAMSPKYIICWKVNNELKRLYLYINKDTYVFEKKYYDKSDDDSENVTTNIFLITNILSFLLGKFLENIIHIN